MSRNETPSGYQTVLLDVEGMKCGGCVRSVETTLLAQPGVINASVNLVTRTAWIEFKESEKCIEDIVEALGKRGFSVQERISSLINKGIDSDESWWDEWRQLIISLILLVLSVFGHLTEAGKLNLPLIGELPFHAALATIAVFGPGWKILKNGAKGAFVLSPSMDTLVGLGVSSAYLASLVALIWPEVGWPCFFNEPVMLLGFVLLGRFLEERARFRTGKALKQLAQLQPDIARLIINDKEIREVRVGALRKGEKVQLLAGDRVPVDGIVIEGNSAVDISSLTGEPLPINAIPGSEIPSGSLNLEADLIIEVKKVGAETALARIIDLVEEAQARKAPIQGLADQVAGKFCYGVVLLALLTFLFWWQIGTNIWPEVLNVSGQGLIHNHIHDLHSQLGRGAETSLGLALQLAIAVLVIACPCALGLATPTVISVASGQAAKRGWLFRGGDVIEIAASIKQVIFDKTGTLTIGRPLVVGILGTKNPNQMLQIAASLESNSRHPLAHAILQKAERIGLPLLEAKVTKTFPGLGLVGKVEGFEDPIRIGKPEWLKLEGVKIDNQNKNDFEKANRSEQSIVAVAHGEQLIGLLMIDDQIRADGEIALKRLRDQGLKISMLSGDRQKAVERIGSLLGFKSNEIGWQLLPSQKLHSLNELQKYGKVAMVGDGINDAPALAASDLGVAIGTGTQIAQESADLVLLGDRLEGLPEAILLAKKTMVKIRQNLIWAFGYNMIALPIAAGIMLPKFGLLLSPPIAALLMAVSSITVVINALSLKVT